ncbi:MAG TPA: GFA family protein [Casimicrobiaceae bacterium]|nr:GFA family protein [Casimicrobiaceae bacterium]
MRTASCSCGKLTATTPTTPIRVSVCHCFACQKRTGSVFGTSARFDRGSVMLAGPSTAYVRIGDSGGRATFHFCPECGATVYYIIEDQPDIIAIPVGAFTDPSFPPPTRSVYENRRHPWVHLPQNLERVG